METQAAKQPKAIYKPEHITVAEYLRRKNAMRIEADPLASTLYESQIRNSMAVGGIVPFIQPGTGRKFIDWNAYKDYLFVVTPKRKK